MAKFPKDIIFDQEVREKLLNGMNILAKAVGSTLGPRSRNVAINNPHDTPEVYHDGVTVARRVNLKDPFEDMGAELLKAAAVKTNEVAGDGTTTATILGQAIISEAFKVIAAGTNPMLLKQEIEEALINVLGELSKIKKPISTPDEIIQVATIASSDAILGKLIGEAFNKVGKDGVITVEDGKSFETTVDYKQGMEIDRGYLSQYFKTNEDTSEAVIEEPYILLTDKRLNYGHELVPFLETVFKSGNKNLVIFAGEVIEEALAVLVINKLRGNIKVCAIQAPAYGDRRQHELEDLAILTGGTVLLEESGRELKSVTIEELGKADKVIADIDKSVIINGHGSKEAIKKRITELKEQIKHANTDFDKLIKEERLAKLAGGVAVVNIGSVTEIELKEKRERVIDAKNATKAAAEEGIVAGGEIALLKVANSLQRLLKVSKTAPITLGQGILFEAMKSPFKHLVGNSGMDYAEIREKMSGHNYPEGVDVIDGQIKNLIEAGIIDPAKVVRSALQNAVSIACITMTTSTLITDVLKEEK